MVIIGETLIHVPGWHTVNLIELAWTFSGVGLLVLVLLNFQELIHDVDVRASLADARERKAAGVLVRSYLRRELIRMFKAVIIIGIGVVADFTPGRNVTTPTGLVLTVGLFSLSVLVGLQSTLDRFDRKRVRNIITDGGLQ